VIGRIARRRERPLRGGGGDGRNGATTERPEEEKAGAEADVSEEPEPDLGIDWARWADGRPHRLTRKRHFANVNPARVAKAAEAAAAAMGKVVVTGKDRLVPDKHFWIQFADFKLGPNQPCRCGSRRLHRVHSNFAKCPQCKAFIVLTEEDEDAGDGTDSRTARRLRALEDVRLERRGRSEKRYELVRGFGRKDGELVFLLGELRIEPDEEQVKLEHFWARLRTVRIVPFTELGDLLGLSADEVAAAWQEREWDIVLDDVPAPTSSAGEELFGGDAV
jgi:hypothetical protein